MSVLIKGGRVVTAADDYVGDVYVEDERITLIGESLDLQADRTIDAAGKYVLPGLIDPHTHLDMPFGGTVTCDDVESGHISAAFGGTTSHVDFVIQPQGSSFAEALETWQAKANGKALIDIGYHMAVTDLHDGGSLEELASLPDEGITSYKLFMAYKGALMVDDETLFRTMEVAAETGALVMVHAENGDAIDVLVKKALAEGKTEPKYHALTRPPETEGEATNRAIQLSRVAGCRLYVVHVSCREAVDPIAIAREKGRDDFSKIPNGGPGLENRLQMMHEFGVRPGRISLQRMVELLSTNPAKYFGLYPRKGTIAVGSDADLVVFDPERKVTISASTHHSKSDYNLFEGTEVTGTPELVLLRGRLLVENGELAAKPGVGQFVERARFGEELSPQRAVTA